MFNSIVKLASALDFALGSIGHQVLRKRIANSCHVQGADVPVMFVVPIRRATPGEKDGRDYFDCWPFFSLDINCRSRLT